MEFIGYDFVFDKDIINYNLDVDHSVSKFAICDNFKADVLCLNKEIIFSENSTIEKRFNNFDLDNLNDQLLDVNEGNNVLQIKIVSENKNEKIYIFNINRKVNDVIFSNNIILDDENEYLKYNDFEFSVKELLANIEIDSNVRIFITDVNGEEKNEDDIVVTGDMFTVYFGSEKQSEYKIAVRGDANGDGKVSLTDLVQLRKHIVGWKNPETGFVENKTGVYFYAIDMNNDGMISLTDLVRVRKAIVGIGIDK